jgi:hypothetical protein
MDVKYAYYNTSKGYKVTGGTAAHFLKADGSLDNASYVTQSTLNSQLSSYANKNGNNATDTWIDSSNGLQSNPTIVGKMANSGGQSNLANATYGQVAGYINTNGKAQGCPTDDWWYKIKMLHNNSAGYYGEIAVQMTGGSSFRYRRVEAGGDYGWIKVWDEQNYTPFKNLIFTGDLESVVDSGIYRQEGPTSGFSYTTTLNLNSSDGRQQLTIERGGKGMKFRGSNAGSGNSGWSGWNEVYHTGNFNPASFVTESALNNQLGNYATMAWVGQNYVDAPDGYSVIISGQDLNESKNTGFYRGSSLGHAPNTGWFFVIVEAHDSTWVKQTATTYGSGNTANMTYQRVMSGGAWSAWQKVWTTQDFSQSNVNAWNNLTNGITLNQEFTYNTGAGLMLVDDYYGGDSGMIDNHYERFVSGKQNDYYKYGSLYGTFDGLNFNFNSKFFGMGREANKNDKLAVEGSVKASQNFKSEEEKPNTIFIPNGNLATLNDEIVNDESEYAIRLNPHEYEIDSSGYLNVDDRNRLIHIIGEQVKMVVDFKKVYYKQQVVIYNFDQAGNMMAVKIQGKIIYNIEPGCFLRFYVTKSLRLIAERQQPCEFIW